jgi:hypothetical protein
MHLNCTTDDLLGKRVFFSLSVLAAVFVTIDIQGLRGIEWVELAFPDVNIARARKRERTRRSVVARPEGKV